MENLATFITGTMYHQIPDEAMENSKKCILDGLGVALAGMAEPASRIIIEYVKEIRAKPEAGVIGAGFKTSCAHAALANGTMAHALDFDDSAGSPVHLTSVLMPAVLALGERQRISGREILESYIIGWEVGAKIADQISTKASERGWHSTGTIGSLSAAVAASKVFKLSKAQVNNAIGIVASQAGGAWLNFGTDTKPLHAGNAAKNGVFAALLAGRGFTANRSILEGSIGFPKMLSGTVCDMERLITELGHPFDIISPGPTIKLYPSCGTSHPSISAMLEIINQHAVNAEDVIAVECRVTPAIVSALSYPEPRTPTEAKFSLQYCMAVALLDGEVTLRQFSAEKVSSPQAQAFMKCISVIPDIKAEKSRGSLRVVTVKLKDGREYSCEATFAKGNPENPTSWDEVYDKFQNCVKRLMDPDYVMRIAEMIAELESVHDISELANLVTARINVRE